MSGERLSEEARWRDLPECQKRDLKERRRSSVLSLSSCVLCSCTVCLAGKGFVERIAAAVPSGGGRRRQSHKHTRPASRFFINLSKRPNLVMEKGLHAIRAGGIWNGITREKRQKAREKRTGGVYRNRQGGGWEDRATTDTLHGEKRAATASWRWARRKDDRDERKAE